MDRKRTVSVASGISLALIVGSAGFAFANGVFVDQPVDRVGTFQEIRARLAPATTAVSTTAPHERRGEALHSVPTGPPDRSTPTVARADLTPEPEPEVGNSTTVAHVGSSTARTEHEDHEREPREDDTRDD